MRTKVLICDDSRTYATGLRMLLEQDDSLEVVGISPSAEHALQSVSRLGPALVTMDLELPGMDGLEAIEEIMRSHPLPVVVLSAFAERGSRKAAAALAAGAVEALCKRDVTIADLGGPAAAALRARLKVLARAHVTPTAASARPPAVSARSDAGAPREARAVGIGASTGGPRALRAVLGALPANFALPVLVVQHIGAESLDHLAHWLDGETALPLRVAQDGAVVGQGIWLSPDGAHLTINRSMRVVLDRQTRSGPHRPSVDVLFESMARSLGPQAAAVVLTGMGTDGARGVAAITAAGGLTIAQDEASSVIFGMPRAAAERGARLVPLADIPATLCMLRTVGQSR